MATGPEHYTDAERILRQVANEPSAECAVRWAAEAQVHATLALAAATAMASRTDLQGMHEDDFEAWDAVAGVQEEDDPYAEMTNADVLSADELYEDERAAEAHLDAIDEERYREENAAYVYDDEHRYADDEDEDEEDDL